MGGRPVAIVRASGESLLQAAALACELWPDNRPEDLLAEWGAPAPGEGAVFAALEDGRAVGFAQCQLRHDYVEGTDSSPVGYLEGIYIREAYRGQGLARALLQACEGWARGRGCTEFASDCELGNEGSAAFHLRAGFTEANRIVCFTKRL